MPDSTEVVRNAAGQAEPGLWAAVRDSVRGAHPNYDYTEGSIGRSILLLSVPMVLEMVMESVFVVWDIYMVGHIRGGAKEAVAAVGLTESMMVIVYTLGIGFFAMSKRVVHAHGVWHLFVIAGSVCHYVAVIRYVAAPV